MDVWEPTPGDPIILNLPVDGGDGERPNVYADQIEWFARQVRDRDCVGALESTRTTTAAPRWRRPSSR